MREYTQLSLTDRRRLFVFLEIELSAQKLLLKFTDIVQLYREAVHIIKQRSSVNVTT